MATALGIDFGTEYCRVATAEEGGRTRMIASQQRQSQKSPAAIGFTDEWLWGWDALEAPSHVTWDLKQRITDDIVRSIRGRSYHANDLIHELFRQLRWGLVKVAGGEAGASAVLTVPYSYGIREREAVRNAVENAGFSVGGLINEAEAAVLGYDLEEKLEAGDCVLVVVFDAGASATKVSVLEVRSEGGGMVAALLMHDCDGASLRAAQWEVFSDAGLFCLEGVPPTMWAEPLERGFARAAGSGSNVEIDVRGAKYTLSANRARGAIDAWRLEADATLSRALTAAELQPRDIDIALPVGGGCEIPTVLDTIAHFAHVMKPPAGSGVAKVCARGAAKYAAMLAPEVRRWFRSAEMPAFGVELADGSFNPVLGINSRPEASDYRVYQPDDDRSDVLQIMPREGFCHIAVGNWPLAAEPIEVPLTAAEEAVVVEISRSGDHVSLIINYGDTEIRHGYAVV